MAVIEGARSVLDNFLLWRRFHFAPFGCHPIILSSATSMPPERWCDVAEVRPRLNSGISAPFGFPRQRLYCAGQAVYSTAGQPIKKRAKFQFWCSDLFARRAVYSSEYTYRPGQYGGCSWCVNRNEADIYRIYFVRGNNHQTIRLQTCWEINEGITSYHVQVTAFSGRLQKIWSVNWLCYAFTVSSPSIESADRFTRLKAEQTDLSPIYVLARISDRTGLLASRFTRPARLIC